MFDKRFPFEVAAFGTSVVMCDRSKVVISVNVGTGRGRCTPDLPVQCVVLARLVTTYIPKQEKVGDDDGVYLTSFQVKACLFLRCLDDCILSTASAQ